MDLTSTYKLSSFANYASVASQTPFSLSKTGSISNNAGTSRAPSSEAYTVSLGLKGTNQAQGTAPPANNGKGTPPVKQAGGNQGGSSGQTTSKSEQAIKLYQQGQNIYQIAAELGVDVATVKAYLKISDTQQVRTSS